MTTRPYTLVDNDCELFGKVLSFIDQEGPLNPMLVRPVLR